MQNYKNLTDEELVEIIKLKNPQMYGNIVERYQNKLLRYAEYLVQDTILAEDIVQETFIKAFVNLNNFNTKRKFSSWIYRITHNETINKIKKTNQISSVGIIEIADSFKSEENIERDYEKEEIKNKIRNNIKQLPLKYSEPLVLFYLEQKTYEETSDILRIPTGTVGTRINRGKNYLKKIIERNQ